MVGNKFHKVHIKAVKVELAKGQDYTFLTLSRLPCITVLGDLCTYTQQVCTAVQASATAPEILGIQKELSLIFS